MQIIAIGAGGFIGAVFRYWLSGWSYNILGAKLPYGTLIVNVIGSFCLGLFITLVTTKFIVSDVTRNLIAIGLLGAFTTFSTFSYETIALVQNGLILKALVNILLNVFLALIAVWVGIITGRVL